MTDRSERDIALADSRNCPHCDGHGLAQVYRRDGLDFNVRMANGEWRDSEHIMATCSCSFGRWMRGAYDKPPWLELAAIRPKVFTRLERTMEDPDAPRFANVRELVAALKSVGGSHPRGDAWEGQP